MEITDKNILVFKRALHFLYAFAIKHHCFAFDGYKNEINLGIKEDLMEEAIAYVKQIEPNLSEDEIIILINDRSLQKQIKQF